jgi:hypothetical protein
MSSLNQNTLNKSFDFGGHSSHEVDEYKFNYMQWLSLWDLCEQFITIALYFYYCIDKLSKFVRFWIQIQELNSRHKFVIGFYVYVIAHMNFCNIYNFVLYKAFCAWKIINYPLFVGLWIIFLSNFKIFLYLDTKNSFGQWLNTLKHIVSEVVFLMAYFVTLI